MTCWADLAEVLVSREHLIQEESTAATTTGKLIKNLNTYICMYESLSS